MQTSRTTWLWTLAIAVLVTTASVMGLVDQSVYEQETRNWASQARGQDIGNLLAVVILLLSGHRYDRGSHRAALVWLGTLMYLVYAYVVYAMALHFNDLFLVYVATLGLSSYAIMFRIDRLRDHHALRAADSTRRIAGYTSLVIGTLFGLLWLSELIPATVSGTVPYSVTDAGLWVNPIHVIDLAVVLPAFIIAGYLTLRGRTGGQFFVGPLLVFSVLMGTSIVAAMILMTIEGFENTLPPLVMVTAVVLGSVFAARRHFAAVVEPTGP